VCARARAVFARDDIGVFVGRGKTSVIDARARAGMYVCACVGECKVNDVANSVYFPTRAVPAIFRDGVAGGRVPNRVQHATA